MQQQRMANSTTAPASINVSIFVIALSFFELTIIKFMFSVLQRYEEFSTPARAKMAANEGFVNLATVFENFASRSC